MTDEHFAPRRVWLIVAAAIVLHLAFSLFVNRPGYMTWDSGTYHIMVKTFADTGSFVIDNGYSELASPALLVGHLRAPRGFPVGQYPETYTLLTLPFYLVLGFRGLLFFNALCFVGIALLVYRLAVYLFGDRRLGIAALTIYSLSTFAWEWSHSTYPHLSSTLAILLAVYGVVMVLFPDRSTVDGPETDPSVEDQARRWLPALGAGVAMGIAFGLRLDSIFVLPALLVPLLIARRVRWRAAAALLAGLTPGVLFLALVNKFKFDTYSPFSYGITDDRGTSSNLWHYLPIALLGVAFVVTLGAVRWWLGKRDFKVELELDRRHGLMAAVASVLVAGVAFIVAPELVRRIVGGTYQLLIDMRVRPEKVEPALTRGVGGEMIYMDGVKKAVLQSCPWLAMLPLALIAGFRKDEQRWRLAFLVFLTLPFIGVFCSLAWHGSIAMNMRYFNPALPSFAILAAWLWRRLRERPNMRVTWGLALASFLIFAWLLRRGIEGGISEQGLTQLSVSLGLAALLFGADLLSRVGSAQQQAARVAAHLLVVCFAFSAALHFTADYYISSKYRAHFGVVKNQIAPHIQTPALIFADATDALWALLEEKDDIILARPSNDDFDSLPALAHHHLAQGRNVYLHIEGKYLRELAPKLRENRILVRALAELPEVLPISQAYFFELASEAVVPPEQSGVMEIRPTRPGTP